MVNTHWYNITTTIEFTTNHFWTTMVMLIDYSQSVLSHLPYLDCIQVMLNYYKYTLDPNQPHPVHHIMRLICGTTKLFIYFYWASFGDVNLLLQWKFPPVSLDILRVMLIYYSQCEVTPNCLESAGDVVRS
jgi:hypothetical protein